MKKVIFYSLLLLLGMVLSQFLPFLGEKSFVMTAFVVKNVTMVLLSFIMIQVGLEFILDKTRPLSYGRDYLIAFTTATFPWIFCTLYFVFVLDHKDSLTTYQVWTESLMVARFSAPTSAGVLFTMLTAAGLAGTWVFNKARILAIFDDLDTILLMIPIKMLVIGFEWGFACLLFVVFGLLALAWFQLHAVRLPIRWPYLLLYALVISFISELIYIGTSFMEGVASIHFEVILPAFVLGCILAWPNDRLKDLEHFLERKEEKLATHWISASFLFFVGLNMPPLTAFSKPMDLDTIIDKVIELPEVFTMDAFLDVEVAGMSVELLLVHIGFITLLSLIGKMFPFFCYQEEATWKERLALALGMCPRGEVGAGIIAVSLSMISYIENEMIVIAMLSLAINLLLTGVFIACIRFLLRGHYDERSV